MPPQGGPTLRPRQHYFFAARLSSPRALSTTSLFFATWSTRFIAAATSVGFDATIFSDIVTATVAA